MTVSDVISLAAGNLRTVVLSYVKKDGTITTVEVEPYSYRISKSGDTRLVAYDVDKQAWRSYLLDRIATATITTKKFTPRFTVEIGL